MDGSWAVKSNRRPTVWDEVLAVAQRPSFDAALSAASMRFLARLRHAPLALLGLLQAVGTEWESMLSADQVELQQLVAPTLDQLPLPQVDSQQWFDLASRCPKQWTQRIRRSLSGKTGPVGPTLGACLVEHVDKANIWLHVWPINKC